MKRFLDTTSSRPSPRPSPRSRGEREDLARAPLTRGAPAGREACLASLRAVAVLGAVLASLASAAFAAETPGSAPAAASAAAPAGAAFHACSARADLLFVRKCRQACMIESKTSTRVMLRSNEREECQLRCGHQPEMAAFVKACLERAARPPAPRS